MKTIIALLIFAASPALADVIVSNAGSPDVVFENNNSWRYSCTIEGGTILIWRRLQATTRTYPSRLPAPRLTYIVVDWDTVRVVNGKWSQFGCGSSSSVVKKRQNLR